VSFLFRCLLSAIFGILWDVVANFLLAPADVIILLALVYCCALTLADLATHTSCVIIILMMSI
jgi:hypothetical protein